jgi:hypothetical protein
MGIVAALALLNSRCPYGALVRVTAFSLPSSSRRNSILSEGTPDVDSAKPELVNVKEKRSVATNGVDGVEEIAAGS